MARKLSQESSPRKCFIGRRDGTRGPLASLSYVRPVEGSGNRFPGQSGRNVASQGRTVMNTRSRAIVAGVVALTLSAPLIGAASTASAETSGGDHLVYARYYHHTYGWRHYRHYGWRHYRHYGWRRHYYYRYGYGAAPVLGGIVGGLAAGLVGGPYYYGRPYGYYYGPGPYWW
jgi:hypothetical protein